VLQGRTFILPSTPSPRAKCIIKKYAQFAAIFPAKPQAFSERSECRKDWFILVLRFHAGASAECLSWYCRFFSPALPCQKCWATHLILQFCDAAPHMLGGELVTCALRSKPQVPSVILDTSVLRSHAANADCHSWYLSLALSRRKCWASYLIS
jgi:hypothetical protein